jgi:hypothetical protein
MMKKPELVFCRVIIYNWSIGSLLEQIQGLLKNVCEYTWNSQLPIGLTQTHDKQSHCKYARAHTHTVMTAHVFTGKAMTVILNLQTQITVSSHRPSSGFLPNPLTWQQPHRDWGPVTACGPQTLVFLNMKGGSGGTASCMDRLCPTHTHTPTLTHTHTPRKTDRITWDQSGFLWGENREQVCPAGVNKTILAS